MAESIRDRRTEPVCIDIADIDGTQHQYTITPHSTTAAMRPLLALSSAFAPLVTQLLVQQQRAKGLAARGEELNMEALLHDESLWSSVGAQLGDGLSQLSPEVLASLFDFTLRDGAPMRVTGNRDAAYAGNMFEFVQAAIAIIRANKFIPF